MFRRFVVSIAMLVFSAVALANTVITPRITCSSDSGEISYSATLPVAPAPNQDGMAVVTVDESIHLKSEFKFFDTRSSHERIDLTKDGQTGGWLLLVDEIEFKLPANYIFTSNFIMTTETRGGKFEIKCSSSVLQ